MPDMNSYECLGNLTRDPKITRTKMGRSVCNFSVACSHEVNGREFTTWVNVQVWGNLAEACAESLQKGSRVFVKGRLNNRSWEQDGQKRYATEIVADIVALPLYAKKDPGSQVPGTGDFSQFGTPQPEPKQYEQEEIPF